MFICLLDLTFERRPDGLRLCQIQPISQRLWCCLWYQWYVCSYLYTLLELCDHSFEPFFQLPHNIPFSFLKLLFCFRTSGREKDEVEPILDALPNLEQYVLNHLSWPSNLISYMQCHESKFCFYFNKNNVSIKEWYMW